MAWWDPLPGESYLVPAVLVWVMHPRAAEFAEKARENHAVDVEVEQVEFRLHRKELPVALPGREVAPHVAAEDEQPHVVARLHRQIREQQRRVDGSRAADGQRPDRDAGRHLDDGQE